MKYPGSQETIIVTPQSGTAVQRHLTGACRRKTARTASYETAITVPVPGHSAGTHGDKYESLQNP